MGNSIFLEDFATAGGTLGVLVDKFMKEVDRHFVACGGARGATRPTIQNFVGSYQEFVSYHLRKIIGRF
jgi:hypothetical protein